MGRGQGGGGGRSKLAGGGGGPATDRTAGQTDLVDAGIAQDSLTPGLVGQDLTDIERRAIEDYTGTSYEKVNAYLGQYELYPGGGRLTYDDLSSSQKRVVDNLPTGLSKLPAHSGQTYRRVTFGNTETARSFTNQFQPGQGAEISTFLSTTKSKSVFGNDAPGSSVDVFMVVNGKRGRDISSRSSIKSEQEVLFTSGSRFKVNRVFQRSSGAYEIHLEQ